MSSITVQCGMYEHPIGTLEVRDGNAFVTLTFQGRYDFMFVKKTGEFDGTGTSFEPGVPCDDSASPPAGEPPPPTRGRTDRRLRAERGVT